MTREEALKLHDSHVTADNLKKHGLATEAVMRELAAHLHEDRDLWGNIGLLHDLDFEYTRDDPATHGRKTVELLAPCGFLPKHWTRCCVTMPKPWGCSGKPFWIMP